MERSFSPVSDAIVQSAPFTLTDGNTIAWDASHRVVKLTLTGDAHTLQNPTNIQAGATYILYLSAGAYSLNYGTAFAFPNGQPIPNPVAGAEDMLIFVANSAGNALVLQAYQSSATNWANYTGQDNSQPQYNPLIVFNGGTVILLKLSNTQIALIANVSNAITCWIGTINSRCQITSWGSAQTLISTIIASTYFSASLISATQFVIGYKKTISATACANVLGCTISGTTVTPGTAVQIRATEVSSGGVEVGVMDSGNFGVGFRTATANIFYVYQCTIDGSNNIVAANDAQALTIETGNASTFDAKFVFRDSTHLWLSFRSTVTATSGYLFAVTVTFSGIANTPTQGSQLQVSTAVTTAASVGTAILPVAMSATAFALFWYDSTPHPNIVLITDSAGTLTAGSTTSFTLTSLAGPSGIAMLDANHVLVSQVDNSSANFSATIYSLASGTFTQEYKSTLLSTTATTVSSFSAPVLAINNAALVVEVPASSPFTPMFHVLRAN